MFNIHWQTFPYKFTHKRRALWHVKVKGLDSWLYKHNGSQGTSTANPWTGKIVVKFKHWDSIFKTVWSDHCRAGTLLSISATASWWASDPFWTWNSLSAELENGALGLCPDPVLPISHGNFHPPSSTWTRCRAESTFIVPPPYCLPRFIKGVGA